MPTCRSGRHNRSDAVPAGRCCDGWHRVLRLDGPAPGDDPEGRVFVRDLPDAPRATFVRVQDSESQHKEDHGYRENDRR